MLFLLGSFLPLLTSEAIAQNRDQEQRIWQNSPTIGLLNGLYDGLTSVAEVRKHGDIGLGTWDRLNGEGLVIDSVFYQVRADGTVHVMPDEATLPWVSVTLFNPEMTLELPKGLTFASLPGEIDPLLATLNSYFALRIDGTFTSVRTRSLPRQSPPYRPFCEVEKTEPKFSFEMVKGTMVGFLSPPFSTNMSVPNWHLHFLAADMSGGGHVLDFELLEGRMLLDRVDRIDIEIPDNQAYDKANLTSIIQCN